MAEAAARGQRIFTINVGRQIQDISSPTRIGKQAQADPHQRRPLMLQALKAVTFQSVSSALLIITIFLAEIELSKRSTSVPEANPCHEDAPIIE